MVLLDDASKDGFNADLVTGIVLNESRVIYRCYEYEYEVNDDGCLVLNDNEAYEPSHASNRE